MLEALCARGQCLACFVKCLCVANFSYHESLPIFCQVEKCCVFRCHSSRENPSNFFCCLSLKRLPMFFATYPVAGRHPRAPSRPRSTLCRTSDRRRPLSCTASKTGPCRCVSATPFARQLYHKDCMLQAMRYVCGNSWPAMFLV